MDGLFDSLEELQTCLRGQAIQSAAIGALAVAVWGQPRLTADIDVKVLLTRDDCQRLLDCLGPAYIPLLDRDPKNMLEATGMLFVRSPKDHRVDLLLSDVRFDCEAIGRGREVEVRPGVLVRVCSPEDLVVYKLISTRSRDHEDANNVIRRQAQALDQEYIRQWLGDFEAALDDSTLIETFEGMLAAAMRRGKA